jgi:energy-converting hydrogenase Eha subunit A
MRVRVYATVAIQLYVSLIVRGIIEALNLSLPVLARKNYKSVSSDMKLI